MSKLVGEYPAMGKGFVAFFSVMEYNGIKWEMKG